jgi:hypothetical protein
MSEHPALTVWQEPDGQWRWRWEGEGTVLVGHRAFDTEEEAEHSARSAYPAEVPPTVSPAPDRRRRRRAWLAGAGVLLVVAARVTRRRT